MDDEESREPKIGLVEAILVGLAILVFGIADIFLPLIGPLFDIALTQIYLAMKGMQGSYQIAMLVANGATEVDSAIPGFDLLDPLIDTITFWVIAWMENHPSELTVAIEKVGQVVAAAEGEGAEGEAVAVSEGATAAEGAASAAMRETAAAAEQEATAAESTAARVGAQEGGAPERKPSEKPAADRRGGSSGTGVGEIEEENEYGEEESPEEAQRRQNEEKMAKFFRQGAETSPEEELEEEVFPDVAAEGVPKVIDINRRRENTDRNTNGGNDREKDTSGEATKKAA